MRIEGEPAKRLSRVLRMRPGERFHAVDDTGTDHVIEIDSISQGAVMGRKMESCAIRSEPRLRLTVVHGIPKAGKLDSIIQKCAELGVSEFVPVVTERTIPRLDELQRDRRVDRWRKISRQATEQCGRAAVMPVRDVEDLSDALRRQPPANLRLILYEEETMALREVLRACGHAPEAEATPLPGSIVLLIGPEGGFAADEVETARQNGFTSVSLGPRILRTETVAPVVAGILLYLSGDL